MEQTEPTASTAPPRAARSLWQAGALVAIVAVLFLSSLLSLRSDRAQKTSASARLFMESTLQARQAYALARMTGAGQAAVTGREALRSLQKLADAAPSLPTLRRLALLQYTLGAPDWKATLLRLRAIPRAESPFETERELAMWRRVLEERPAPAEVPALRRQIVRLRLGWYEHLALEAMYRHAGLPAQAEAQAGAALRSTTLLILITLLGLAAGLFGLGLLLGVLVYRLWRRAHPEDQAPPVLHYLLEPACPPLLSRPKADALYFGFLVYLATFALIRFVVSALLRLLLGDSAGQMSSTTSALLSLVLAGVSLAVPLLALRLLGRPIGLTAADLGFRSCDVRRDVLWGVGGYLAALPLIWLTALLSSWLFKGFDTPLHPALAEFAGGGGALFRLLLFAQAAIMAPLAEETMFRGVFFGSLAPRVGRAAAILLASGVFAILHPQLPLGFLGIFILGVTFNLLYVQRGSLLPSMIAHALNNGMIFLLMTLLFGD